MEIGVRFLPSGPRCRKWRRLSGLAVQRINQHYAALLDSSTILSADKFK
jgi:hypothetical protein